MGLMGRNTPGFDRGDVAAFGWEMLTDPFSWVSGPMSALTKAGKAAKGVKGTLDATRKLAAQARAARWEAEYISLAARSPEDDADDGADPLMDPKNNELIPQLLKAAGAETEKQDTDFEKLAGDVFGNRKDEALKGAKTLIASYVPEKMKSHVANLSNENLIVLAGVLDAVRKEYISEDRLPKGGAAPVGMSLEQKQARGRALMASPEYTNQFHPDHAKVKAEVDAIYGTA
jgi:hypothetical protein